MTKLKLQSIRIYVAAKPMKRDHISPFFSPCTADFNHDLLGWAGFPTADWTLQIHKAMEYVLLPRVTASQNRIVSSIRPFRLFYTHKEDRRTMQASQMKAQTAMSVREAPQGELICFHGTN